MDVAMGRVPQAGLVAQGVVLHPAAGRIPEGGDQVLNPGLLGGRAVGDVGVVGVVAGDVGPVGVDAVAPVGVVRVGGLLRAVLGDREAAEVGAVGPELGGPVEQVEGDARLGAAGPGV